MTEKLTVNDAITTGDDEATKVAGQFEARYPNAAEGLSEEDMKDILAVVPLKVGLRVYVQTCTKDWVGIVASIDSPYMMTLVRASWVADSGRMHVFVRDGRAEGMEVEYVGQVAVSWVNWIPWPNNPFTESV